ncbi:MAG TPA: ChbG/HpnK family deacetylase [Burkholderiales bacterium]|nr:ChbG/HpnK family deacetylase [Burkholderiales bacterium]
MTIPDKRLIINADDFGLSEGVSRGIVFAAENGIVTSTSVIVNMPGWKDTASLARSADSRLSFGLHLNLVVGKPLTSVPTLLDAHTSEFLSIAQLTMRALTGRIDPADVARECTAQLERLTAIHINVTHVDSHRHSHALPQLASVVARIARENRIRFIRRPLEPLPFNPGNWRATVKKAALAAAWRMHGGDRASSGIDHFYGISLQGEKDFASELNVLIDRLPIGTSELMVHPGYVDEEVAAVDGYTSERAAELAALTSPALRQRLDARGITLVNFLDPLGASRTPQN